MSKKIILYFSILLFILSSILFWNIDVFVESNFLYDILVKAPIVISLIIVSLTILYLLMLMTSIIRVLKKKDILLNLSSIFILLVILIVPLTIPFNFIKTKLNYIDNKSNRELIIKSVISESLVKEDDYITLPIEYSYLSEDGKVLYYKNEFNKYLVSFLISNHKNTYLIYTTGNINLINKWSVSNEKTIKKVEKLDDNWFYLVYNS